MDFNPLYTLQKQTDAVMEILCKEQDEVTFVNYYLEASKIVKDHFKKQDIIISTPSVYALVKDAVKLMLGSMPDPKGFIAASHVRDIFAVLEKVIRAQLKMF